MAVYYYLAVACEDQEAATMMTDLFDGMSVKLVDGWRGSQG